MAAKVNPASLQDEYHFRGLSRLFTSMTRLRAVRSWP